MSVLVLTPPRKALTWATVPVMVIDDVPVPEMVAPESPAVAAMVPSPTESVTDIEPEPASTSEIERPVPFKRERHCLRSRRTRRRDDGARRVVDGRDVDGRGVLRGERAAAGVAVVVDGEGQRGRWPTAYRSVLV